MPQSAPRPRGPKPSRKLSRNEIVLLKRALLRRKYPDPFLARQFGVHANQIGKHRRALGLLPVSAQTYSDRLAQRVQELSNRGLTARTIHAQLREKRQLEGANLSTIKTIYAANASPPKPSANAYIARKEEYAKHTRNHRPTLRDIYQGLSREQVVALEMARIKLLRQREHQQIPPHRESEIINQTLKQLGFQV